MFNMRNVFRPVFICKKREKKKYETEDKYNPLIIIAILRSSRLNFLPSFDTMKLFVKIYC